MRDEYCWRCGLGHAGPDRYSSHDEHLFRYGRLRPVRFKADVWKNMHDVTIPINQMTKAQLKVAILFIEKGYRVYGQRSKEISLRKALAKLENGQ